MDTTFYDCPVDRIDPAAVSPIDMPSCPVCGQCTSRPTFAIASMQTQVVVCTQCGLGRLHPQPDVEEIRSFYPSEYYGETGEKFEPVVETLVRLLAARRARFLARGLPAGARVLDIGCGRGVLLGALADRGCEVHGIELSEAAAIGADPRAKIRIAASLDEVDYPPQYFDEIVLWHVLEHVPNPRQTLEEAYRILRPGGHLVVAVPNFSSFQARWAGAAWFHLDLPRHLFHFPLSALRQLAEDCGFECRSEHHFSLRQNPFGWVQSALNRCRALPRNALYSMLLRGSERQNRRLRFRLRLAYLLGMPVGLVLSIAAALLRSGATVHIVATRRPDKPESK